VFRIRSSHQIKEAIMASAAPRRLESYVYGAWTSGKGDGLPLLDAGTGETVALIGSKGLDFAEVLNYGRTVAGQKLRAMSFHERAAMLKALGLALMGKKEQF
jgi:oxepin-CoA hydrolase/3-oxo-5,6-dehydrosuberyl-CoA semialdehyde dehydrogenase